MLNNGTRRERRKRYGRGSYLAEILGEEQYFDVVMKVFALDIIIVVM